MNTSRILIAHNDPSALALLASMLQTLGHALDVAENDRVAVRLVDRGGVDVVVAGADPDDPEALDLLTYMRRTRRQVPVILLFSKPCPERSAQALRLGASTVLRYPCPATELRAAVTQAVGLCRPGPDPAEDVPRAAAAGHARSPSATAARRAESLGFLGSDPCVRQVLAVAGTVAGARTPVLIVGEPGTGKALLARTIHDLGPSRDRPFAFLDCSKPADGPAALPAPRPEAPRGPAFDPDGWRTLLARSRGGTVYLNRVADLPPPAQALLVRTLQDHDSRGPDGGDGFRFILSDAGDLSRRVERGDFRPDLFHRLGLLCLRLPPLRHRGGDLDALAGFFLARCASELNKPMAGLTRDALETLHEYNWPGNVRELERSISGAAELCRGTRLTSSLLMSRTDRALASRVQSRTSAPPPSTAVRPLKEALEGPEKTIILQTLQAQLWNRQETAQRLDINRTTLYKKMRKYGLLKVGAIWED